ncbi:hypothetical protein CYMTET_30764 [Cymbomonas tetramitiformis]|uniref:Uncharacterized protein n=1 Tax=Cymbomonas tetramitiformis TaxID=36881 RepID=A0AAE0KTL1_9CHLO|nr:hypothetical protein CYMTET_30764 [Cymbomonas tetramitiformis]
MQLCLSAINSNYHEDLKFTGPAKGRAISRAVKGMSRLQAAAYMLGAFTYAVFAFVTFGRPETCVSMRMEHISIAGVNSFRRAFGRTASIAQYCTLPLSRTKGSRV